MVPKRNETVFLIFLIASLVLRFYSFFPAVIDHDESTYLIIGRDIALGKQLYVDVTDTKPAGIFLIYTLFYSVFGKSLFLPRLFVTILVAFTAFLVSQASFKLVANCTSAFAAGMIYIFYTSVWSQFGIAPNTEVFFNLTTIAGFLFLLDKRKWSFSLAGLLFGIGFIIKYLVLFDFVFLVSFFLIREMWQNKWRVFKIGLLKYILSGLAFALPFLLTNLYFYLGDYFDAFKFITYELPSRYGKDPDKLKYLFFLLDFIGRFFPISFFFFYALLSKSKVHQKWQTAMFISWIAGIIIAMYLPGKSFDHYSIQLMIPFSLVAGMFFHPELKKDRFSSFVFGRKYGFYFLAALVIIVQTSAITGVITDDTKPKRLAEYLSENMEDDDTLYLSNYKHIVYYLIEKECPTKYVHPTLLTNPEHSKAFGIDGHKEIEKIVDSKPTWIIIQEPYEFMTGLVQEDYQLANYFDDENLSVYKRIFK